MINSHINLKKPEVTINFYNNDVKWTNENNKSLRLFTRFERDPVPEPSTSNEGSSACLPEITAATFGEMDEIEAARRTRERRTSENILQQQRFTTTTLTRR